jgi:hypothetical protein
MATDLTVRDVVNGLEAMEEWARRLRDALGTLDQGQPLRVAARKDSDSSIVKVSGGQCPPRDVVPLKRGKKTGKKAGKKPARKKK